jgi:hypothetical protein
VARDDRIRVIRTIVIEGPRYWVETTLDNSCLDPEKGKVEMGPKGGYLMETRREKEDANG